MNAEHLTLFWGLLMGRRFYGDRFQQMSYGDRFYHQGIITKCTELLIKINSVTTHRDISFSHKPAVSSTSSQGYVLVMATLRGAGRPRSLSCSLNHWAQASSGLEDVTAPYAEGFVHVNLGTVLQAKELCSRCTHLFKQFLVFSFPLPEFPLTYASYRKEKPFTFPHNYNKSMK